MGTKSGRKAGSAVGYDAVTLRIDGGDFVSPLSADDEMAALYRPATGFLVHANLTFCGRFGLDEQAVYETPLPPSLSDILCHPLSEITRDRPTARTVHRFEQPDGEARRHEWTVRGFFASGAAPEIVMITGREISGYGAAMERVSEFDAYYQHFIERLSDVVYFTDTNGIIRYISGVVEQVSQWKPDEVTGIHYMTFIHPDDVMSHIEYMKATLNGEPRRPFISRIRKKDGTYQYATMVSRRLIREGSVEGVVGIISHAASTVSNEFSILKMLLYLLSKNERTVLILLAGNEPRRNIARTMNTVPEAVDTYIRRIKKKLNAESIEPIVEMIRMFPRNYFLSE